MTGDIKNFFLGSPMHRPEYMKLHITDFLPDIVDRYQLHSLMSPSQYVYIRINKGMYGLKQAALLAYEHLVANLAPHGYYPVPHSPGIWRHKTRKTRFCLCVDDFGIKYFNQDDANHLLAALRQTYEVSVDWTGQEYCGLHFEWNYDKNYVDVSMPRYVPKLLAKLKHPPPKKPCYSLHDWTQPVYGQTRQYAIDNNAAPILPPSEIKRVQSVAGSTLYYSRAVDPTILPAIN